MKKDKSKKSSKYSLLKAIGIAFLIFAVLSWIIPAGTISSGTYTKNTDGTIPVGLFGLFSNPLYSFGIFAQYDKICSISSTKSPQRGKIDKIRKTWKKCLLFTK